MKVINGSNVKVKYFLYDSFFGDTEVSEKDFYDVINVNKFYFDREFEPGNVNRLNFFHNGDLWGYRIKC